MVPAFEIPTCILPDKIRNRVLQVQERVGIVEEKCLAVALPVVNKELFQVTKNTPERYCSWFLKRFIGEAVTNYGINLCNKLFFSNQYIVPTFVVCEPRLLKL